MQAARRSAMPSRLLDLAQGQQPAVRGELAAVEAGNDGLAGQPVTDRAAAA